MSPEMLEEDLLFTGEGGRDECTNFIRSIRRIAFEEGRQRDDSWVADRVAVCMTGQALIWHLSLDGDISSSWERLQRAMIAKFAADDITPSHFAPTPAKAIPAAVINNVASPPPAKTLPQRRGHVRISVRLATTTSDDADIKQWTSAPACYLSRHLNPSTGGFRATTSVEDALIVRFMPSDNSHNIFLVNSPSRYACLGATMMWPKPMDGGVLAAVQEGGDTSSFHTSYFEGKGALGSTYSAIWSIGSGGTPNGIPVTASSSPSSPFTFCMNTKSGSLFLCHSLRAFKARLSQNRRYSVIDLAFIEGRPPTLII
ncbi:hypothetical protein FRB99_007115 [Tulasnella sp. 403]|nr:hypothetical protein FRB99_007115 [Tulasnella sp. 403]